MRTDTQVLQQILTFARDRECIRAVAMNGSRVNPNAPKDLFNDYDVVCYTTNPRQFVEDQRWISAFGELIILQQNDFNEHGLDGFIFLMQFTDGVRIDLAFDPLEYLLHLGEDSLTTVLLDKDNRIPPLPPASDRGYHTRRPTRKLFDETVNDIFWCSGNVAKGIWRDELAYVKYMADNIVRTNILHLLEWYAAMNHGWSITTGTYGKWLESFLPPEVWEQYTRTYAGPDYDDTWEALFTALSLVRQIGPPLAQHLGYEYPLEDDRRVIAHLQRVRALPRSATEYPGMDAQP